MFRHGHRAPPLAALAFGLLVACGASAAMASSVAPMTIGEMADHAAQVIVGEVSAVRSYWHDGRRRIESEVMLANVEYWKGGEAVAGEAFRLIVPGGEVDARRYRLCCAPEFSVGQRRILFLLQEYRTFPTVGLWQGAFLLHRDHAGIERVYQDGGGAVVGIGEDGNLRVEVDGSMGANAPHAHARAVRNAGAGGRALDRLRGTTGPAVREVTRPDAPAEAMTLAQFRERLMPVLAASRQHRLHGPAGQPVDVALQPTNLKLSPREQAQAGGVAGARGAGQASPRGAVQVTSQAEGRTREGRSRAASSGPASDSSGKSGTARQEANR